MRLPFQRLTGLAKSAAILASILGISIGLCGANVFLWAVFSYGSASGLSKLVTIIGIVEAGVMVLSGLGLIAVALLALARWIHHRFFPNMQ